MMFTKSAIVMSFLALGNIAAATSTKACLISAVGQEKNPADLKAICVTNVERVQNRIEDECGDDTKVAMKQFADTCESSGHKVVVNTSTSANSSSTAATGVSKSSSAGFVTATSTPGSSSAAGTGAKPTSGSGSGSGSSTSASVPLQTTNAGSSDKHIPAAAFAAVVFVGFAATF
ncbi:hypothetical protein BDV25DRAFT_161023 [Aspergillus avenaceus]|uniref:GPI anchored cell wall protein n=1 Tax=Aspergillus avenaceus TaxID=36643 RepID=A0A5N6TLX4_ASPAV|nr:hypothetical protein BDV25DRAFT_161023 [Aspergillus avenaceus]